MTALQTVMNASACKNSSVAATKAAARVLLRQRQWRGAASIASATTSSLPSAAPLPLAPRLTTTTTRTTTTAKATSSANVSVFGNETMSRSISTSSSKRHNHPLSFHPMSSSISSISSSSPVVAGAPSSRNAAALSAVASDDAGERGRRPWSFASATALLAAAGTAAVAANERRSAATMCDEEEEAPTTPAKETAATTATETMKKKRTTKTKKKKKKKRTTETKGGGLKRSPTEFTPSFVAEQDFEQVQSSHDIDQMPVYTLDEVADNNGEDGKPVWMTYGGVVYDVTDFLPNHPGGTEKILMAAGSSVEPYWHLYRQHFASDLPMRLMENMAIGRLDEKDQAAIDDQMTMLLDEVDDPYALEPMRHKALLVHSDTPMNAEVPAKLLTDSYLTPASLFYIRHHHPVPYLNERQAKDYRLKIDVSAYTNERDGLSDEEKSHAHDRVLYLKVEDLKEMESVDVVATLQCSGNRRNGFNKFQRTSGTPWGQGAISTAKFTGVRLSEILRRAGLDDPIVAQEKYGMEHVRFHALDGMSASIGIEKAVNPYGDVIVCYAMNGEPLSRDHGYPLRVIVPGYAAVRNVKWLDRIELSKTEAEGAWQRGLNYKTLPPSVTDAKMVNLDEMPSLTEVSLFSGITNLKLAREPSDEGGDGEDGGKKTEKEKKKARPGQVVTVRARGWAWAGGGRNVVRVDVTGDFGRTWATAKLLDGKEQRFGRAWAWVFWECDVPAVVQGDGTVQLASKAVDMAFNVQPESPDHTWNVRGLGNNAWFQTRAKLSKLEED